MAKEELQLEEQDINQSDNQNELPVNLNLDLQKESQQFLEQLDTIVTPSISQSSQNRQTNNQNTQNDSQPQNSTSTNSNTNEGLKVRVLKKNSLDGDVSASLRDPMSSSTQSRVVEKNNLEGNVEADLKEPEYEHKDEEPKEQSRITKIEDIKPIMSIGSVVVEEGSTAVFAVTFDKTLNKPFNVTFNTSTNGTAEPEDIDSSFVVKDSRGNTINPNSDGSFTVPSGETSLRVEVLTKHDNIFEGSETFELNGKTEFMSNNTQGQGTIKDDGTATDGDDKDKINNSGNDDNLSDDDRPTLTFDDATMEEGSTLVFAGHLSNATEYAEDITLSTDFTGTNTAETTDIDTDKTNWTVTYLNSSNVTQTLTVDTNGKFTLPAGVTSFNVKIPTTSDNVYEGAETFTLSGDAASSYITDTDTAVGTITDNGSGSDGDDSDSSVDDDRTKFSIDDKVVYEGSTITFTVTRVGDAEANQTIDYAATIESGNTAESGDFTAGTNQLSGTLTFAPGEFTKTITLNVPVDADSDDNETFTVTLSNNSTGSLITDAIGIGTIRESNTPPEGTDKTIALAKNTSDVLEISDFGYSDADGDVISKVKITNISNIDSDASLLYFNGTSWVPVVLNQEISKSDIDNGYLVFKPGTNEVGLNYSSFGFLVSDGTAYDDDANTITYNIKNTLTVSDPLPVDEGESAIFVIRLDEARTAPNGYTLLDLSVGGAESTGDGIESTYYYKNSSGVWTAVSGNQVQIVNGQTSIEIKVVTKNETTPIVDNGDSLTLTATINSQSGTDTASDMANTSDTGNTTVNDYASLRIDTKPYILEGQFAVFEIGLSEAKNTTTTITLGGGGTATMGTDYSQNYEYSTDGGNTWLSISNFTVDIPASVGTEMPSILVRTLTSNDGVSEPDETITLIANTTDSLISTKSVSATTIVVDQLNLTVYESGNDVNLSSQSNSVTMTAPSGYSYTLLGQGENGTVQVVNSNLVYTPKTDFSGEDSFTFIKTNLTTGLSVTTSANVTVYANADTPDISINLTDAVIENLFDSNNWKEGSYSGNSISSGSFSVTSLASTDFTLAKSNFIIQTFASSEGQSLDLSYAVSTNTGTLSIFWGYVDSTNTLKVGSAITTSTVTVGKNSDNNVYNAIVLANTDNQTSQITFSSISLVQSTAGVKIYDVDIYNALKDGDNENSGTTNVEQLQDVTLQVKTYDGSSVIDSEGFFNKGTYNTSTDTWTFTQSQLQDLQVTVSSTLDNNGFKLVATATAKELGNTPYSSVTTYNSTASNTATITIKNSDDRPEIGDINISIANETNLTTDLTNVITTYFSTDHGNAFSWESSLANIPALYVDGKLLEFTYVGNQAFGKAGGTTYLTITAIMDGTEGSTTKVTDFKVEQSSELFGLQTVTDGDIVLPGGGNLDSVVLAFETSQSNTSVAVDCLVVAHNTIEDQASDFNDNDAEHTVNTNNYYIGVDSNNMNAGDQLIMDFAAVGSSYSHASQPATTSYQEISSIVIDLFNFNSSLTVANPDALKVTLTKVDGTTESIDIVNSMLMPSYNGNTGAFYTVTSTDGQAFTKIQFDAGSTSSFKLGIAAIGSISYNKDFDIELGYSITDSDGDKDTGTATISFDGDNSIVYDSSDTYINGSAGTDTLVLDNGIDIDFSTYTTEIKNIEKIDMTDTSSANTLSNMELQDIIDITDSNNLLKILGDSTDSVSLKSENGNDWSTNNVVDSDGYKTYVNDANGGTSISLKIDSDITVSII